MSSPSESRPNPWAVAVVVGVGVFMATLDTSIVNISLPAIARQFGVPLGGAVEWVVIAYLVVIAATLLSIGRLADMVPRKWIWGAGLVLFVTGSVACGFAPSLGALIACRALQGLGGSCIMAVSPAMLTTAFPEAQRGRALGFNAVMVACGVAVGPTLGGVLTQRLSWRWIFFVNLPVGLVGLLATFLVLRHVRAKRRRQTFDPWGAALLAIGLGALTAGLSFAQELGWKAPWLIGLGALSVAALAAVLRVERRVKEPVLRLELFSDRLFASSSATLVLSFLALFAVQVMMPFYLEQLRGFTAEKAGFLLTPLPLMIGVLAPISGRISDRHPRLSRWLTALGLALSGAGLVVLGRLGADAGTLAIIAPLALIGVGQALFQSPNNSVLLGSAPRAQRGVASGMLATGRVVGQSLSVALSGAVFGGLGGAKAGHALAHARQAGADASNAHALSATFMHAFHATCLVCAAVAVLGVLACLVRGSAEDRAPEGVGVPA